MAEPSESPSEGQVGVPAEQGEGLVPRAVLGGSLMGIANLVPGISGGTMLLASGVYQPFIQAIADVSTFRWSKKAISMLLLIALPAAATIVLLAGPIKDLVETRRWVMYALFIGLTLGGVPVVLRMAKRVSGVLIGFAVLGFALMLALALAKPGGQGSSFAILFVAGIAGASAMILPGVSGAYLLLILGQYATILGAIRDLKGGVKGALSGEGFAALAPAFEVVLPVGLGVVAGIVGVSSVLKWALAKHREATLGMLLGLLLGSVIGIWPFQRPVAPDSRELVSYAPEGTEIAAAIGLILVGLIVTLAIDRYGRSARAAP